MRAIVWQKYGPPEVLKLRDVPRPIPGDKEVLIKIRATTVTAADCLMRRGDRVISRLVLGIRRPRKRYRILGIDILSKMIEESRNRGNPPEIPEPGCGPGMD